MEPPHSVAEANAWPKGCAKLFSLAFSFALREECRSSLRAPRFVSPHSPFTGNEFRAPGGCGHFFRMRQISTSWLRSGILLLKRSVWPR